MPNLALGSWLPNVLFGQPSSGHTERIPLVSLRPNDPYKTHNQTELEVSFQPSNRFKKIDKRGD
jgi:hypothetical protein